jgi:preprotein translocase subunit SecY
MFATIKQIFNPKNKDLQKRILFTLGALFVFKLGIAITVPGIDKSALGISSLGFLELVNAMGGRAMEQYSIFSLGVMPYITASIIIQLLEMDIIPYFADLAKEGHTGRVKLNTITRYVGIALAFIQGYMFSLAFVKGQDAFTYMKFSIVLTAGTAFLLWLGDQVTAKGIGNGISMIIMAGIIASLPSMFISAWDAFVSNATTMTLVMGIISFVIFVSIYFAIMIGVVYEQLTERRINVQYANRSATALGKQNYIPFKLNSAGVIPVIFASSALSMLSLIAKFIGNSGFETFVNTWLTMTTPTGLVLYVLMIILFAYFYTFLQVKPKELAENLQQNGGYIPAVRPGHETVEYIYGVLNRITIVGAIALAVLAGMPIIFGLITNLPSSVSIGGTGLLIVVGVALETYKQIESRLVSRSYTRGRK